MILALSGVPLVIVSIIAFILILGLIIIVHEGGHFFFARRAGILCHEFSIGMGPAIYKKKIGETLFCIRAIPIGGYVSMAGEGVTDGLVKKGEQIGLNLLDNKISEIILDSKIDCQITGNVVDFDLYGENGNPLFITINNGNQDYYYEVMEDAFYVLSKDNKLQLAPYDRCFESKSIFNRFITLVAGAMMNLVLAFIIYLIVSFATGVPNYESNVIGNVSTDNTSLIVEVDGNKTTLIQPGDQIIEINGESIESWNDIGKATSKFITEANTLVNMVVLRDGKTVNLEFNAYTYIVSLGISNLDYEQKELPAGLTNGLIVGKTSLKYLDQYAKPEYPLSYGDVITHVQIDIVNADKTIIEGNPIELTSWDQMIELFKDVNVANVRFRYYSYSKNDFVEIADCAYVQTYGDELLANQRMDKIQVKIGIEPETKFSLFPCIGVAGQAFWNDFTLIFRTLGILIAPQSGFRQVGVGDLSSFVGIFDIVMTYIGNGLLPLLSFCALLSVNIGVMNLLPIPALDGGRIVFLGYELITKKKPSKKVENLVNNIFFILLMILFVYVTFNDIFRMI